MTKKATVFLVEDDFIFLEMLKEYLADMEEEVSIIAFQSGEDCINNLHLQPDIIVLDYFLNSNNIDAQNGLEVLKQIMKIKSDTKVIILSGQEDIEIVYKLNQENAHDYIVKDDNAFVNIKESIKKTIEEYF